MHNLRIGFVFIYAWHVFEAHRTQEKALGLDYVRMQARPFLRHFASLNAPRA